jgi:hypothetical protein
MSRSPPLRFLLLLLAAWTGSRAVWLAPGWWTAPAEAGRLQRPSDFRSEANAADPAVRPSPGDAAPEPLQRVFRRVAASPRRRLAPIAAAAGEPPPWPVLAWQLAPRPAGEHRRTRIPGPESVTSPVRAESRWSFAAWSFLRQGDAPALAPGGTLGGSQAGALARYRLNRDPARPLALSVRLSTPVRQPAGAEAALGLDWRPSRRVPVHLLAERRQGLGRDGRSAFALMLHGGVSDSPLAGLRVEAYAQAGIVGTRSSDLFGDGALRLSVPLGRFRPGGGAWAAAQPGLSRLDLGPQASIRLPVAGRAVTLAADWRFRVAGTAKPGSGPALTVATEF